MTTTRAEAGGRTDRLILAGTCVVVLCSAVVSVWVIGSMHAPLGLHPLLLWVLYALAATLHLTAVQTAWSGARESDVHVWLVQRYRLKVVTAVLMVLGGIATLMRVGVDPVGVLYVAAVCGCGPLLMLLVFLPRRQHRGHAQAHR